MITGMIALILVNGLGFFWPRPLVQLTLRDGEVVLGEVVNREPLPVAMRKNAGDHRIQLKLGNRDITGTDFRWVDESAIVKRETPAGAVYVERRDAARSSAPCARLPKASGRSSGRRSRHGRRCSRSWNGRKATARTSGDWSSTTSAR